MNIKQYRQENDLSQSDFAQLLSKSGLPTTQGLVSQWEQGLVTVTPERAIKIESITGIPRKALRPDIFDVPERAA